MIESEEWRHAEPPLDENDPDHVSDRDEAEVLAEAASGVERYRKGDGELTLLAPDGAPAANRPVEIVQTGSAFLFGSPVYEVAEAAREGLLGSLRMRNYAHWYTGLLNAATALCYWHERGDPWMERYQGETLFREFVAQADWARAHGLTVKGHPLVWSVPKAVPPWLRRYDPETRMKFLEVRVRNLVAGLRGKVDAWDVVNEMLWEPSWRHIDERKWPHLEPIEEILTYVSPALRWCREENPDAKLLINEYGIVYSVRHSMPEARAANQRKRYRALAEALADAGTPPDALGVQAHTGGRAYRMADVRAVFDELAGAGLPLHVTEFGASYRALGLEDADLSEEEKAARQADYMRKFYTVAFGHPALEAVFYWGLPRTAFPFRERRDQRIHSTVAPRPCYEALRQLIREEWMTRIEATSDEAGKVRFRGFFGDYRLRADDARGSVPFTLARPGPSAQTLTIA